MKSHIISVLVDNEFGVLARIVGLFAARGYNIDSLSVAKIDEFNNISRINITTSGTDEMVSLIVKLLENQISVRSAINITAKGLAVERGLCLCKVASIGDKRVEALRIAQIFGAKVVDTTENSFVFEISGKEEKLNAFIDLMRPLGLTEVSKTGPAALNRGK